MQDLFYGVVLLLSMVVKINSFGTGAPISACSTMTPGHGFSAMSNPCPYLLSSNEQCFQPGQRISLRLQDPNGQTFKGMLVEARLDAANPQSFGSFDVNNNNDIHFLNCFGSERSAITHSDPSLKLMKEFGWTAPTSFSGRGVNFTYSVVQVFDTYWVQQRYFLPLCNIQDIGTSVMSSGIFTTQTSLYTASSSRTNIISEILTSSSTGINSQSPTSLNNIKTINYTINYETNTSYSLFGNITSPIMISPENISYTSYVPLGANMTEIPSTFGNISYSLPNNETNIHNLSFEITTPMKGIIENFSSTSFGTNLSESVPNFGNMSYTPSVGVNSSFAFVNETGIPSLNMTTILYRENSTIIPLNSTNFSKTTFPTIFNSTEIFNQTYSTFGKSEMNITTTFPAFSGTNVNQFNSTQTQNVSVITQIYNDSLTSTLRLLSQITTSTTTTTTPGGSCQDLDTQCINLSGNKCYNHVIRNQCCSSCSRIESSNPPGCAFGDRISICGFFRYPTFCQYYGQECCLTCRNNS